MILNYEQIGSITHGAVKISEENGVYGFERFSDGCLEIYEKDYHVYYERALSTASVYFEFDTDSEVLSFGYTIERVRDSGVTGFDLLVDGESYAEVRHSAEGIKDGALSVRLPKGTKRVMLIFPSHYRMTVRDFAIDDGASIQPVKREKRVLFLGDSITQGFWSLTPSVTLPNLLLRKHSIEVLNQGIGSMHMFSRCIDSGIGFKPELVLVLLGTNDWNSDPTTDKIFGDSRAYLERCRQIYPEAMRVFVSPLWRTDRDTDTKCCSFDECKAGLFGIAEELGYLTVDGEYLIPHDPALLKDSAHPNEAGFLHYAEGLDKALTALGIEL